MCKCCQHCMESCYWHLIEEKFCFDENIALYEDPSAEKSKNEKNNNMFDNMAFYDSVSVIAGRAIVTIDPLPDKKKDFAIVSQPKKRLTTPKDSAKDLAKILEGVTDTQRVVPFIVEEVASSTETGETTTDSGDGDCHEKQLIIKRGHKKPVTIKKAVSFNNILDKSQLIADDSDEKSKSSSENLTDPENNVEIRRKGLRERRMSRSLYLKIDFPKEIPIVRQNSMPKFYLDTPDEGQIHDTGLSRPLSTIFQSPIAVKENLDFDLYTVVQLEKTRAAQIKTPPAPIHRSSSKINLIKEKVMLKKSKSTVSASTLPYSNHI